MAVRAGDLGWMAGAAVSLSLSAQLPRCPQVSSNVLLCGMDADRYGRQPLRKPPGFAEVLSQICRSPCRRHDHSRMNAPRQWFFIGGMALVLLGLFLPRDWYDALPKFENQPPLLVKGVTLLQITLVMEGVVLAWLATRFQGFVRLQTGERLPHADHSPDRVSASAARWLLGAIVVVAAALRFLRLDADLWLDEITPVLSYGDMPLLPVVTSYIGSNNHLLNTLLLKLSLALFGSHEWAVRLPAALFGVLTIPAMYWVSRLAMTRAGSLCAALLLAVSYHHVFFSQNARGYAAYLLFSLLASGCLVRALQEDRARYWVLYVATMFLDFASLLTSGFVFAAHILVAALALVVVWRGGSSPWPLARRLAAVFSVTAALVLTLYVTILPQLYAYTKTVYSDPATGFSPLAAEFWTDIARGLSAGLGPTVLIAAIPMVLIGAAGFAVLLRRQWALVLALLLPGILTACLLVAQGLSFSPRFFLLMLLLGIIVVVQGIFSASSVIAARFAPGRRAIAPRVATALVLAAAAISVASLKHYYATPKQPYRASLEFIATQREAGEPVMAIHLMEKGYQFYGPAFGMVEGVDWHSARSLAAFDAVLAAHPGRSSLLVTTFPRALRIGQPDLFARVNDGAREMKTFPATIGDGAITVWRYPAPYPTPYPSPLATPLPGR